jgi:hypothetical protein
MGICVQNKKLTHILLLGDGITHLTFLLIDLSTKKWDSQEHSLADESREVKQMNSGKPIKQRFQGRCHSETELCVYLPCDFVVTLKSLNTSSSSHAMLSSV